MGASIPQIIILLSKDFILLVMISFVFALPIAYWGIDNFLNDFPSKIAITWWLLALPGIIVILIALVSVGYQTLQAATNNPVNSLRYE